LCLAFEKVDRVIFAHLKPLGSLVRRLYDPLARFMPITVLCKQWDSIPKVSCMRSCSGVVYCIGVLATARSPTRGFLTKT
jgi:hypothetical protein